MSILRTKIISEHNISRCCQLIIECFFFRKQIIRAKSNDFTYFHTRLVIQIMQRYLAYPGYDTWLIELGFNISINRLFISATVLLRQFNVLRHRDMKCNPTYHPTQSQYTDTGPTSPNTNLVMPTQGETAAGLPIFKSQARPDRGSNARPSVSERTP